MREMNILITGIGGQGILSASRLLAQAVQSMGEKVIVGDAFGASQREGSVTSNVRIGSHVHGPMIAPGMADYLIAFEPYEALRCLHYLAPEAEVIANTQPIIPIRDQLSGSYPSIEEVWRSLKAKSKTVYQIPASETATRIAAQYKRRYDITNVVILGAASAINGFPIKGDLLKATLQARFHGPTLTMNLEALEAGQALMRA